MNAYPDVANDLWIIREWLAQKSWRNASEVQRENLLADTLADEQAGHELPESYTASPRLHVFGADDCEVWLGCLNAKWVSPEKISQLIGLMISDLDMACAVSCDGVYVVALDGCEVTGWYRSEVHHGTAD